MSASGSQPARVPAYDRIGVGYGAVRRPDPRLERAMWNALGDAEIVLNIGAGTGSYEPGDRTVIAVEPSAVMIAQRPADSARAIRGVAESIPLAENSVDATMGVFTMQHWDDLERGIAEVLRVTRKRIVFLTLDLDVTARMWLCRDYLPEIIEQDRRVFPPIARLRAILPDLQVEEIPCPVDCTDGFCVALWSRPESYLDPHIRHASSIWHQLPPAIAESALGRLRRDLDSGAWEERYGHLRTQATLDIGLRLVKVELPMKGAEPLPAPSPAPT